MDMNHVCISGPLKCKENTTAFTIAALTKEQKETVMQLVQAMQHITVGRIWVLTGTIPIGYIHFYYLTQRQADTSPTLWIPDMTGCSAPPRYLHAAGMRLGPL